MIALGFFAAGCSKQTPEAASIGSDGSPRAPAAKTFDQAPPDAIRAKIDTLRLAAEFYCKRAENAKAKFMWWTTQTEHNPDLAPPSGMLQFSNMVQRVDAAASTCEQLPPVDERLHALAKRFAAAVRSAAPVLDQANDAIGAGRQAELRGALKSPVIGALNGIVSGGNPLRERLDELMLIWHEKMLAKSELLPPGSIEFLCRTVFEKARKVKDAAMGADDATSVRALQPAFDNFKKADDALEGASENSQTGFERVKTFLAQSKLFSAEVRARLDRLKMHPPFNASELAQMKSSTGWMVPGAKIRTQISFDELKEIYYSLTF